MNFAARQRYCTIRSASDNK